MAKLLLTVLDEYRCYYHKYSSVEEQDSKDGAQESTKENTRLTNEATVEKVVIAEHGIANIEVRGLTILLCECQ